MIDLNKIVAELAAKKPAKKAAAKKPAKKAAKKSSSKKKTANKNANSGSSNGTKPVSPARQEQLDRAAKAGITLPESALMLPTPALKGIVTKMIAEADEAAKLEKAAKKAPIYFAVSIIGEEEEDVFVNFTEPPLDISERRNSDYVSPTTEDVMRLRTAAKSLVPHMAYISRYVLTYKPKNRSTFTLPLIKAPVAFKESKASALTAKVKSALATALTDPKQSPVMFSKALITGMMRSFSVHKGTRIIFPDGYKIGLPVHGPVVVYPIQINTHYYQNAPDILEEAVPILMFQRLNYICRQVTSMATVAHMMPLLGGHFPQSPILSKMLQLQTASRDEKEIAIRVAALMEEARSAYAHSKHRDNPAAPSSPFSWATKVEPEELADLLQALEKLLREAAMIVSDRPVGATVDAGGVARRYEHWRDVYRTLMRKGLTTTPKPEPIVAQTPAVDSAGLPVNGGDDAKPHDPLRPNAKKTSPTSVPTVPKDKAAQEQFKKDNGDGMDGLYTAAIIGDTVNGVASVISSL